VLVVTLLVWVLFGVGGDVGVLFGEDTDDVGSNFVVNYSLLSSPTMSIQHSLVERLIIKV
jgi:hypothetical protein